MGDLLPHPKVVRPNLLHTNSELSSLSTLVDLDPTVLHELRSTTATTYLVNIDH